MGWCYAGAILASRVCLQINMSPFRGSLEYPPNMLLLSFLRYFYCSCSSPVYSWSGPSISILDLRVSRPTCYRGDHQAVIDIDIRILGFIPTIANKLLTSM